MILKEIIFKHIFMHKMELESIALWSSESCETIHSYVVWSIFELFSERGIFIIENNGLDPKVLF